jgi:hypothetical protein
VLAHDVAPKRSGGYCSYAEKKTGGSNEQAAATSPYLTQGNWEASQ